MAQKQKLSEEEMSELSQALSADKVPADSPSAEVRSYDFMHPDKLSRMNLRALQLIFSSMERPWSGTLSDALKGEITVQVGPPEQTNLGAYLESIPKESVITTVTMRPLPGGAYMDMPSLLALGIIDSLICGKAGFPKKARELTQIELSIVKRLLGRLLASLSEAWRPVAHAAFSVSEAYQSVDELEVDARELVLTFATTWTIAGSEHRVNFALPVGSLDRVLEALDPHKWTRGESTATEASRQSIVELMEPIGMEAAVELGHSRLTMQDLLGMEVGDVVRLDRGVDDPLAVKIGDRTRFLARPGLIGTRLAIQIKSSVSEAEVSASTGTSLDTEPKNNQE